MIATSQFTISVINDGQDGAPGQTGPQGVSVNKVVTEYRLSDSNTELSGSGTGYTWSETKPEIPSGKYLWERERTDLSNNTSTYGTAHCDIVISGLVLDVDNNTNAITSKVWQSDITNSINSYDGSTGAAIRDRVTQTETNISGITSRVSDVETVTDGLGTRMTSAESSITQNANNIATKVSQDSVISSINQSAEAIQISASKIDINGAVTFSSFDTTLQNRITTAESNASTANTNASSAVSTANTASTNASNALSAVNASIKSTTMHYLATNAASGVTRSTSGWTTTVQSITSSKRYLWTYQTITKVDNTTTDTDPVISGVWGNTGTSVTVSSNVTTYQVGDSGTTAPTGTWQNSVPTVADGKFLWTRVVTTFSDSSTATSYSVAKQGVQGTSVTVSSTSTTYQSGTSGTTAPTGTWQTSIPTVAQGNYLWTKTVVTYSDGNSTTSYAVSYQSEDGNNGVGVTKVEQLYRTSNSTTAPAAPTSVVTSTSTTYNTWTLAMPTYNASYPYYYTCTQTTYTNGDHSWTTVARSKALEDANTTANTANTNASAAVSTANTASTNASNAVSTANTANTNASNAVSTANTASSTANTALKGIKAYAGTCSTATGTAAKVVSCSDTDFEMTNGTTITVKFSEASTAASPTLNVNSKGAKAIYFDGAVVSSSNLFRWQAGSVITFQYDGTYWVVLNYQNLDYFTCSTAAGTAAKATGAVTGTFVLCKGTTITVFFGTSNTANAPTLNVGSTGGFAIYYKNAVTSSSNQYLWSANTTVNFTFNGSYWYVNDGGAQLAKDYAKTAVDWVGTNGTSVVTAKDIISNWAVDATSATTTINGGLIEAHTILAQQLATNAIMSENYVSGTNTDIPANHFSTSGSYLDLESGSLYMPSFHVDGETGDAYFKGTINANDGIIGGWNMTQNKIYNSSDTTLFYLQNPNIKYISKSAFSGNNGAPSFNDSNSSVDFDVNVTSSSNYTYMQINWDNNLFQENGKYRLVFELLEFNADKNIGDNSTKRLHVYTTNTSSGYSPYATPFPISLDNLQHDSVYNSDKGYNVYRNTITKTYDLINQTGSQSITKTFITIWRASSGNVNSQYGDVDFTCRISVLKDDVLYAVIEKDTAEAQVIIGCEVTENNVTSKPFYVQSDGLLHTENLDAVGGTIGRWTISSNRLYSQTTYPTASGEGTEAYVMMRAPSSMTGQSSTSYRVLVRDTVGWSTTYPVSVRFIYEWANGGSRTLTVTCTDDTQTVPQTFKYDLWWKEAGSSDSHSSSSAGTTSLTVTVGDDAITGTIQASITIKFDIPAGLAAYMMYLNIAMSDPVYQTRAPIDIKPSGCYLSYASDIPDDRIPPNAAFIVTNGSNVPRWYVASDGNMLAKNIEPEGIFARSANEIYYGANPVLYPGGGIAVYNVVHTPLTTDAPDNTDGGNVLTVGSPYAYMQMAFLDETDGYDGMGIYLRHLKGATMSPWKCLTRPIFSYPVGSVYITDTNTNPSTILGGGTWTLIKRVFENKTVDNAITWNSTNVVAGSGQCAFWLRDTRVTFRIRFTNKVAIGDTTLVMGTIDISKLGISGYYYGVYVALDDTANSGIMMDIQNTNGECQLRTIDVVGGGTVAASTLSSPQITVQGEIMFNTGSILDSACNEFHWQRTA